MLHVFFGERVTDWQACREFVRRVAYAFKLPYFTITPTFSICKNHGYLCGEVPACTTCGEQCEVWSRIVGYFRPVDQWNKGKKSEFAERLEYAVEKCGTHAVEKSAVEPHATEQNVEQVTATVVKAVA